MSTQLKERPIILTAEEVNAVLAGDKTQHRVPIEESNDTAILFDGRDWRYDGKEFIEDACCDPNPRGKHYFEQIKRIGNRTEFLEDYRSIGHCPLGKVGDRLWVQEDWTTNTMFDNDPLASLSKVTSINYIADSKDIRTGKFRQAEDMHRIASRILLEITDVRIERVQDISEADAMAMGLKPDYCDHKYQTCEDIGCIGKWAGALWLHLRHDKKYPVHHTAWVWVIEFKKVDC